ncbi:MAG: kinase/pyrophosphorylase [Atopobiaceae bacterium]|jgi:regulator of PEP synthase PpsR (kinase-PPPase family)|nr:kinase/pyrophosphorylase [Atopobiaceae bacterium]
MTRTVKESESVPEKRPITVHVISDSLGGTAGAVVRAAAVQFDKSSVSIGCLSHVSGIDQVRAYRERFIGSGAPTAVFHTILDEGLREELRQEMDAAGIPSVDLLGPAMGILSKLTGSDPLNIPGLVVDRDASVVRHIDARTLTF